MQRGLTHALGLETGLVAAYCAPDSPRRRRSNPRRPRLQPQSPRSGRGGTSGRHCSSRRSPSWRSRGWALRSMGARPGTPLNAIVVLPFATLSGSDRDLSQGIELLISDRLSALSSARVVDYYRTPWRGAIAAWPSTRSIRRHGVDGAVQGNVTWSGGTARVAVEVVRAGVLSPIWSRQFERPVLRAAELPRDVSREIARALAVDLTTADEARLSAADAAAPGCVRAYPARPRDDAAAHECVHRARGQPVPRGAPARPEPRALAGVAGRVLRDPGRHLSGPSLVGSGGARAPGRTTCALPR